MPTGARLRVSARSVTVKGVKAPVVVKRNCVSRCGRFGSGFLLIGRLKLGCVSLPSITEKRSIWLMKASGAPSVAGRRRVT